MFDENKWMMIKWKSRRNPKRHLELLMKSVLHCILYVVLYKQLIGPTISPRDSAPTSPGSSGFRNYILVLLGLVQKLLSFFPAGISSPNRLWGLIFKPKKHKTFLLELLCPFRCCKNTQIQATVLLLKGGEGLGVRLKQMIVFTVD